MKCRKASTVDILSFVLIFTMFAVFMAAYVRNNVAQEGRSLVIDYLNTEASNLQKQLEGYSQYYEYSYMFENGNKLSQSEAQQKVNNSIQVTKQNIINSFNVTDKNSPNKVGYRITKSAKLIGEPIITINDTDAKKGSATVTIAVNYSMQYKSPYMGDSNKIKTNSRKTMEFVETITKIIENSYRIKNI